MARNRNIARYSVSASQWVVLAFPDMDARQRAKVAEVIAMHNTALPPVAEFDAFVSLQLAKSSGKQKKMTGAK